MYSQSDYKPSTFQQKQSEPKGLLPDLGKLQDFVTPSFVSGLKKKTYLSLNPLGCIL